MKINCEILVSMCSLRTTCSWWIFSCLYMRLLRHGPQIFAWPCTILDSCFYAHSVSREILSIVPHFSLTPVSSLHVSACPICPSCPSLLPLTPLSSYASSFLKEVNHCTFRTFPQEHWSIGMSMACPS